MLSWNLRNFANDACSEWTAKRDSKRKVSVFYDLIIAGQMRVNKKFNFHFNLPGEGF